MSDERRQGGGGSSRGGGSGGTGRGGSGQGGSGQGGSGGSGGSGRRGHDGRRTGGGGGGPQRGPERRKPATPAPSKPGAVQPARRVALDVIAAVRADDAYANLLLPMRIADARLSPADAGLATELTYGTLRRRGYYDRVIELASGRPIDEIDGAVRDVLELGAHQLLSMRVAQHAAVNESVELARAVASRSATGFVNGVLRAITRTPAEEWLGRVTDSAESDDDRLALTSSHPAWIVRAFRRALVADGVPEAEVSAELDALLEADNTPARLSLVALPGLADREALQRDATAAAPGDGSGDAPGEHPDALEAVLAGASDPADDDGTGFDPAPSASGTAVGDGERRVPAAFEPAPLSPIGLVAPTGDPASIPAVRAGTVRVQDEGSQLAALALTRARPITAGERWLDLCAGPGGKTAVLAAEAGIAGATVTANEPIAARAGLVRRAVAALPEPPVVWERDGTRLGRENDEGFDRILVDAPCTGLGALRRRPEARWRKTPADVAELVALQQQLIDAAVAALKPGGLLAYVTCSPHVAETRGQVQGALRRWPDALRQLDAQDVLRQLTDGAVELGGADLAVQLWPHRNTTDAMFIALFEKR
ncbi:RsmB/NOP family class I SAM-dependent RNA methyltransferase [Herbiconiux sp. VKM Ac-2851]|uniref:RsmB/NOP family class I SAM-dependent RNA methyltransferase n=1 Tax=Herbiconiux sp. VKM Ac-2851 TaxID=2739025 RepID=UPI00156372EF|nr:transcription antitermination factor NusB [Herbiconiux sp. VKM Ac-2851]NQX33779.1 rRNA small subunit methyltransferase B [Herbiconiux sp. VKM Ac-2851]